MCNVRDSTHVRYSVHLSPPVFGACKMTEERISKYVSLYLQHSDFEDLLEMFDLTPEEVFVHLYDAGKIDEELLSDIISV